VAPPTVVSLQTMLDPRIYRMGIVPVVLAVIVLAFSLEDQSGALSTNIVPDAFNGGQAYAMMQTLARRFPNRTPGSAQDGQPGRPGLASYVAGQLRGDGFTVSRSTFRGPTPGGPRTLQNVIGSRAGGQSASIVVVSDRDAVGGGSQASLSGTAVMLELANVLSGQTLSRTLVMVSTTGSDGAVGARQLISQLPRPIDAVLVLGDMAGVDTRQPLLVPWSDGQSVAPPALRNTVASALTRQTGLVAQGSSLPGQVAHLAFPMTGSEQAPLDAGGLPAVLLSLSGDRSPSPGEATSPARLTGMGRAALEAVTALEGGPAVGGPSAYLLWSGKVIPAWAVRLLVLILILPVLAVTVDGLARARRRGQSISRWLVWVVASALPFVLASLLVLVARATGWIGPASSIPVRGGSWPLGGGGIALLALMGVLIVAGLVWLRPMLIGLIGPRPTPAPAPAVNGDRAPARRRERDEAAAQGAGAAAGVLLVLCVVSLLIWVGNPFAAVLLVPALHLWIWVLTPDIRLPLPASVVLVLLGLAPVGLLAAYFALTFGLGPVATVWTGVLMLAGGGLSVLGAVEWSLLAGCAISVVVLVLRAQARTEETAVTVRGPVSYAGPGSLGGTESALRR
jgi:hypothetical protein